MVPWTRHARIAIPSTPSTSSCRRKIERAAPKAYCPLGGEQYAWTCRLVSLAVWPVGSELLRAQVVHCRAEEAAKRGPLARSACPRLAATRTGVLMDSGMLRHASRRVRSLLLRPLRPSGCSVGSFFIDVFLRRPARIATAR